MTNSKMVIEGIVDQLMEGYTALIKKEQVLDTIEQIHYDYELSCTVTPEDGKYRMVLSGLKKRTREMLQKQSYSILQRILESDETRSINLSDTKYGYIGTDNMTDEQLLYNIHELQTNLDKLGK